MGDSHGDTDGPAELYAESYSRLVGVLSLVAGDRAEAQDVVQEAFARLIPRWSTVGRYDDPEAWVRKVAFRLLANRRRQLRRLVLGGSAEESAQPAAEDHRTDVGRALARLPLAQRQVVVLFHLFDLSVAEVAAELGVPAGTVKSRLSRARADLAPLLREDVHDHA
ncbi:MAG: sigma-70 family RNA polymerase sigma factor [Geodermatophilaceae bacterium]|nr:sigma-70 family RNA polymerase sigma factor [Geodermatophilaceae bacterium]